MLLPGSRSGSNTASASLRLFITRLPEAHGHTKLLAARRKQRHEGHEQLDAAAPPLQQGGEYYDKALGYATGTWALPDHHLSFRFFRLYQLDAANPALECSGIEFYGELTEAGETQASGKLTEGVFVPE